MAKIICPINEGSSRTVKLVQELEGLKLELRIEREIEMTFGIIFDTGQKSFALS